MPKKTENKKCRSSECTGCQHCVVNKRELVPGRDESYSRMNAVPAKIVTAEWSFLLINPMPRAEAVIRQAVTWVTTSLKTALGARVETMDNLIPMVLARMATPRGLWDPSPQHHHARQVRGTAASLATAGRLGLVDFKLRVDSEGHYRVKCSIVLEGEIMDLIKDLTQGDRDFSFLGSVVLLTLQGNFNKVDARSWSDKIMSSVQFWTEISARDLWLLENYSYLKLVFGARRVCWAPLEVVETVDSMNVNQQLLTIDQVLTAAIQRLQLTASALEEARLKAEAQEADGDEILEDSDNEFEWSTPSWSVKKRRRPRDLVSGDTATTPVMELQLARSIGDLGKTYQNYRLRKAFFENQSQKSLTASQLAEMSRGSGQNASGTAQSYAQAVLPNQNLPDQPGKMVGGGNLFPTINYCQVPPPSMPAINRSPSVMQGHNFEKKNLEVGAEDMQVEESQDKEERGDGGQKQGPRDASQGYSYDRSKAKALAKMAHRSRDPRLDKGTPLTRKPSFKTAASSTPSEVASSSMATGFGEVIDGIFPRPKRLTLETTPLSANLSTLYLPEIAEIAPGRNMPEECEELLHAPLYNKEGKRRLKKIRQAWRAVASGENREENEAKIRAEREQLTEILVADRESGEWGVAELNTSSMLDHLLTTGKPLMTRTRAQASAISRLLSALQDQIYSLDNSAMSAEERQRLKELTIKNHFKVILSSSSDSSVSGDSADQELRERKAKEELALKEARALQKSADDKEKTVEKPIEKHDGAKAKDEKKEGKQETKQSDPTKVEQEIVNIEEQEDEDDPERLVIDEQGGKQEDSKTVKEDENLYNEVDESKMSNVNSDSSGLATPSEREKFKQMVNEKSIAFQTAHSQLGITQAMESLKTDGTPSGDTTRSRTRHRTGSASRPMSRSASRPPSRSASRASSRTRSRSGSRSQSLTRGGDGGQAPISPGSLQRQIGVTPKDTASSPTKTGTRPKGGSIFSLKTRLPGPVSGGEKTEAVAPPSPAKESSVKKVMAPVNKLLDFKNRKNNENFEKIQERKSEPGMNDTSSDSLE